jgi:hypothetical protein
MTVCGIPRLTSVCLIVTIKRDSITGHFSGSFEYRCLREALLLLQVELPV